MFKNLILTLFAGVFIQNIHAQTHTATLIKDIATSTVRYQDDAASMNTAHLQNEVFFSASINYQNYLVAFDGTNKRVVFNTGAEIDTFVVANNKLFFTLNFQNKGWRVWTSDGTTAGTIPVSDTTTSRPFLIGNVNNKLLFGNGTRIYSSTGTLTSTVLVRDIPDFDYLYKVVTTQANKIFISVTNYTSQSALWVTDGTTAGTLNIANSAGANAFNPEYWNFTTPGNPTFFRFPIWKGYQDNTTFYFAEASNTGLNLWQTDGTVVGTRLVLQDAPIRGMLREGSNLLISLHNSNQLYLYDGLTTPIVVTDYTIQDQTNFIKVNGGILLNLVPASAPTTVATYKFDGTNFAFFRTFATTGGEDAFYGDYYDFNGYTYFVCNYSLWKTNGTANGSVRVKNIGTNLLARGFVVRNNKLFFTALDVTSSTVINTLFVTGGTVGTTLQLPITLPDNTYTRDIIHHKTIDEWGDNLYILIHPKNSFYTALWRTDGTLAGTLKLADTVSSYRTLMPIAQSQYYSLAGNKYCNMATKGNGFLVHSIGNTPATTQPALRLNDKRSSRTRNFYPLNAGKMLFVADDGVNGACPWVTDGTPNGTQLLYNINLANSSIPGTTWIGKVNNILYFFGFNPVNAGETGLWRTDGTPAGTYLVKQMNGISKESVILNNKLYFVANNGISGWELWATDGTTNGTQLVKDIVPGADSSVPTSLILFNNKVYFMASNNALWTSDGTMAGTVLVKTFYPNQAQPSIIYAKTIFNGALYFRIFTNANPLDTDDVWRTDGTANGTFIVKNLNPSTCYSYEQTGGFVATANALNFQGTTDTNGCDIMYSDGTNMGTWALTPAALGFQAYRNDDMVAALQNKIVFKGTSNNQKFPYIADRSSIVRVSAIPMSANSGLFTNGDKTYFSSDENNPLGSEYCRVADSTFDSGAMMSDIFTGEYSSFPQETFPIGNGKFVFTAENKDNSREIWLCDNTNPPVLLADVQPGVGASYPLHFHIIGNDLVFTAFNENTGRELYKISNISNLLPTFATANTSAALHIFPNPTTANTTINIENATTNTATLYDITGKMIEIQTISTAFKLPNLAAGIYILRCGQAVAKVIVQE